MELLGEELLREDYLLREGFSTLKTAKNVRWAWTAEHQAAFEKPKALISREVVLVIPDFSQPFAIYTDACNLQLGAVVAQNNKLIAFFSRKLNPTQRSYTTTERELETLK